MKNMYCIDKFTLLDYNIESIHAGGTESYLINSNKELKIYGMNHISDKKPETVNKILCTGSDLLLYI